MEKKYFASLAYFGSRPMIVCLWDDASVSQVSSLAAKSDQVKTMGENSPSRV